MAASSPLFELPIQPDGNIICTQPAPKVYLLTFTLPPDNRLRPAFNEAFMLALDLLEQKHPKGVVITTSGIPKFYSNGLDLSIARKDRRFFVDSMYPLWRRLLTYPMPTIALLNGHAFAGGLITAMAHDYRVMNPHKGFLCMNEVEFGAPMSPAMLSVFGEKLRADTFRNLILEAKRFNALEALKEGLVDSLGGLPETLTYIAEMKIANKGESGVYGHLKSEMWRETVGLLDRSLEADVAAVAAKQKVTEAHNARSTRRVEDYLRARSKL